MGSTLALSTHSDIPILSHPLQHNINIKCVSFYFFSLNYPLQWFNEQFYFIGQQQYYFCFFMQKVISTSCYDAVVIKHEDRTYRSTPFQVVFSSNLLKLIEKNRAKLKKPPYKLTLHVNERLVDIAIKVDKSGRVVFEKAYNRKASAVMSDSQISDDDISQRSSTKAISKTKNLQDKLEEFKNQQAPTKFWQFAWLFSKKTEQTIKPHLQNIQEDQQKNQSNLTKIKQQIYEGEQHSKQPLFHLSLCGNLLKKKESKEQILKIFYDNRVLYSQFLKDPTRILADDNLVVKIDDSIYTWQLAITILTCRFAFGRQLTKEQIQDIVKTKFTKSRLFSIFSVNNITKLDVADYENERQAAKLDLKKIKNVDQPVKKYTKDPDSDMLKKMKLKYGKNIAKFQIDVGDNVKQSVTMRIFLWDPNQKIVISDIDGTITKSDILGQILKNYLHSGVVKLYQQIYKRQYKIIYLTARAIGQYQQTFKFLQNTLQQNLCLPQGPLLMSPDGYVKSFNRQVIYKNPDELKIKILASVNQVFPTNTNPIYCGFGNRQTDSTAYARISIPLDKIYCINEKSIISRMSDKDFVSSYNDLLQNINEYFPEYFKDREHVDSSQQEQFQEQMLKQEVGKKTKSVDGGDRTADLDDYSKQFVQFGNIRKNRKSQHEISLEDLKSLEQLKFFQKQQLENLQKNLMNSQNLSIRTKPKAQSLPQSPIRVNNQLNQKTSQQKITGSPALTPIKSEDQAKSKEQSEVLVVKDSKQISFMDQIEGKGNISEGQQSQQETGSQDSGEVKILLRKKSNADKQKKQ